MGLYKRGKNGSDSPYWWMRIRGGGCESTGIPHTGISAERTKELKAAAQDILDTRLADRAKAKHGLAPAVTTDWRFKDLAEWYLKHRVKQRPGAERSSGIVDTLIAAFGKLPLAKLTRQRVEEWITSRLTKTRGPSTVNREVDELKVMLKLAADLEHITASPIAGMPRLRTATVKRRLLTHDEERRLLKQFAPADKALFLMGMDTLVRLSDLLDLRWEDVDLAQRLAHIRDPKDPTQSRAYDVELSSRVVTALEKLTQQGKYVFWHRRIADTDRDRRGGVRLMLQAACKRCDPPIPYGRKHGGITFHWATRRTGASRMIQAGTDIKTVQEIGHWASPDVVLAIYSESDRPARRRAVERVSARPK